MRLTRIPLVRGCCGDMNNTLFGGIRCAWLSRLTIVIVSCYVNVPGRVQRRVLSYALIYYEVFM